MTDTIAINDPDVFPILLVDDEWQINDILNQIAKAEFPQANFLHKMSVESAQSFLTTATGWVPRLIILDIDLKQDKNGLDLLAWIRQHPLYRVLPVIILSVVHEEEIVREAYAKGANIFTNKPFGYTEWKAYVQYLATYWFSTASTPKLWVDNPTSPFTNS
ncbi:hypothetical protein GCM10027347_57030 [Larkinella harenae]